jgi:glutamate 5-kinase
LATRETVCGLIQVGVIPVVWDESIILEGERPRYTYSDQVAALIAGIVGCQSYFLLIRHDGIQIRSENGVERLREIDGLDLSKAIEDRRIIVKTPSDLRTTSIVSAAKLLNGLGISMQIVGLSNELTGRTLLMGNAGTVITARPQKKLSALRRWLSVGAVPRGTIIASPFAASRLSDTDRSSLLAAGVLRIEGDFVRDDVIAVVDQDGLLLGYGLTRLSSAELMNFQGKRDIIVIHADHFFGFDFP